MFEMTELKITIPSKGREKTIARYSLALFPDAVVPVDEREIEVTADDLARAARETEQWEREMYDGANT